MLKCGESDNRQVTYKTTFTHPILPSLIFALSCHPKVLRFEGPYGICLLSYALCVSNCSLLFCRSLLVAPHTNGSSSKLPPSHLYQLHIESLTYAFCLPCCPTNTIAYCDEQSLHTNQITDNQLTESVHLFLLC